MVLGNRPGEPFVSVSGLSATVTGGRVLLHGSTPDIGRQVFGLEDSQFPNDDSPMDGVFQLADISIGSTGQKRAVSSIRQPRGKS